MKDKLKKINYYSMGLVTVLFLIFGISLVFQKNFQYYDYGLFMALLVVCIISLNVGLIIGLIICVIVMFGYGSVVFFQMTTSSTEIWSLNYMWFLAFPISTFFAGEIKENIESIYESCLKCQNLSEKVVAIDEVTGFGNAREFFKDLDSEMSRARRHKITLTLAVIEIQYFEELIAIYGNENLKDIYKSISNSITASTRVEDLRYRIAADELAVILPHTTEEQAKVVKVRIKEELSRITIDDDSSLGRYNIELKIALMEYDGGIVNPMEFKNMTHRELEYDV